jgi:hypothetical protein
VDESEVFFCAGILARMMNLSPYMYFYFDRGRDRHAMSEMQRADVFREIL